MNPLRLNSLAEVQRLCTLVKSYSINDPQPSTILIKAMTCVDETIQSENFFIKTNNSDHYLVLLNSTYYLYKILDSSFPVKTYEDKLLEVALSQDRQEQEVVDAFL
jgi:hypothetical protein